MRSASGSFPTLKLAPFLVLSAYVACCVVLFLRDTAVIGPFTFVDEAVYFQLARNLWEHFNYAGHTAYNPLYSFLLAPFFMLRSETAVYAAMRIFNILLWASLLFPVYWLARRWIEGLGLPLAIAVSAVLMPASADVSLIRAEPLFYPLFALTLWFGWRMLEEENRRWAVATGIASGLLFLTKQGGLALVMALGVTSVFCWRWPGDFKARLYNTAAFLGGFLILALPWMIRTKLLGGGVVGYGSWVNRMMVGSLSVKLVHGVGLNITYTFVALWGGFFVIYLLLLARLPTHARSDQILGMLSLAVLASEILFGALISVVLPEHESRRPFLPTGRYIDNALPCLWIFIFRTGALKRDFLMSRLSKVLAIWFLGVLGVYYYSLLQAVVAKSAAENPSLSFLALPFTSFGGDWWGLPRIVSAPERWVLTLGFAALAAPFLLLRERKALLGTLCVASVLSGLVAGRTMANVAIVTKADDQIARWLLAQDIPANQIAFDTALQPDISPFSFWFPGVLFGPGLRTASSSEFLLPIVLDFSKLSSLASGSSLVANDIAFQPQRRYGFDPSGLPRFYTSNNRSGSTEHFLLGNRENRFRAILPEGLRVNVSLDFATVTADGIRPVDFTVAIGDYKWRIRSASPAFSAHLDTGAIPVSHGELDVIFLPQPMSSWVLSRLEVTSVDRSADGNTERYFVTAAKLPVSEAYSMDGLYVYDVQDQFSRAARKEAVPVTDHPLTQYTQKLASSVRRLSLSAGQVTTVPVTVTNPGPLVWGLGGEYPILLSCRWFAGDQMLSSECPRTPRTRPLRPGESDRVDAEVIAPNTAGAYTLRLSLVQERVAWFFPFQKGLDISVVVH